MRPENPSDRNFFHPQLRLYDPCTHTNVSSSKILAHNAKNEHFPPPIPRSLLSVAPRDNVIRQGLGRGFGSRSGERHSTSSRVFPYTSFVLYRFLRALQQNRAQSRLLYLLIELSFREFLPSQEQDQSKSLQHIFSSNRVVIVQDQCFIGILDLCQL